MIYARKDRYGMLWQFRQGDGEELIQAWEYARTRHGADNLTGHVYGREPVIRGIKADPSIPAHCWLFELRVLSATIQA